MSGEDNGQFIATDCHIDAEYVEGKLNLLDLLDIDYVIDDKLIAHTHNKELVVLGKATVRRMVFQLKGSKTLYFIIFN